MTPTVAMIPPFSICKTCQKEFLLTAERRVPCPRLCVGMVGQLQGPTITGKDSRSSRSGPVRKPAGCHAHGFAWAWLDSFKGQRSRARILDPTAAARYAGCHAHGFAWAWLDSFKGRQSRARIFDPAAAGRSANPHNPPPRTNTKIPPAWLFFRTLARGLHSFGSSGGVGELNGIECSEAATTPGPIRNMEEELALRHSPRISVRSPGRIGPEQVFTACSAPTLPARAMAAWGMGRLAKALAAAC